MQVRVERFHHIDGSQETRQGGREKVPASFYRQALTKTEEGKMRGDRQKS